jgi:hypothetical protein
VRGQSDNGGSDVCPGLRIYGSPIPQSTRASAVFSADPLVRCGRSRVRRIQGWIKELTFNSDYLSLISERFFDDAAPGATNKLVQTPDGSIYQLTFDGKLTRISPSSEVPSTV